MAESGKSSYLVPITEDHAVPFGIARGVFLTGEKLQLAVNYLDPGTEIPWHTHEAEVMVTLLAGEFEIWIGDQHFFLRPGFAAWIPSNVPHRAINGSTAAIEVEAFAPVREEFAGLTPQSDFRRRA